MKIFKVIKEYISPYLKSILFKKGEIIKSGKEYQDNPNLNAWILQQFLNLKNSKWLINQNYDALELSVSVGKKLVVLEEINGFMKAEKTNGDIVWVPLENLEFSGIRYG